MNLTNYTFDELVDFYAEGYTTLFGKVKAVEVTGKILNSSKVQKLISSPHVLNKLHFKEVLNTIGFFLFAKQETFTLGLLVSIVHYSKVCKKKSVTYQSMSKYLDVFSNDSIGRDFLAQSLNLAFATEAQLTKMVREVIEEDKITHYVLTHSGKYLRTVAEQDSKTKLASNRDEDEDEVADLYSILRPMSMPDKIQRLCSMSLVYFNHNEYPKFEMSFNFVLGENVSELFQYNSEVKYLYIDTLFIFLQYKIAKGEGSKAMGILEGIIGSIHNYLDKDTAALFSSRTKELV